MESSSRWTRWLAPLLWAGLSACGSVSEAPPAANASPEGTEAAPDQAAVAAAPTGPPARCLEPAPERALLSTLSEPGELLVSGDLEDRAALPFGASAPGELSARAARTGRWGWALPAGERLDLSFIPEKTADLRLSVWVRAPEGTTQARLSLGGPARPESALPAREGKAAGKAGKAGKTGKAAKSGAPTRLGDWVTVGEEWVQLTLRESMTRTIPLATLTLETEGAIQVDDLSITAPVLTAAEGPRAVGEVRVPERPAAPFHFAFLVHIEDESGLSDGGARWEDNMAAVEGLARTLHAHGGALTVQPELDWVQGAAAASGGTARIQALVKQRGLQLSTHTHGPVCVDDTGAPRGAGACKQNPAWAPANAERDVLAYVAERRNALGALAGRAITDHNGNFELASYAPLASLGVRTLSAYKDRNEQSGLPSMRTNPWRPGGSGASVSAFQVHDPLGPVVYLPGAGLALSRDLARLSDRLRRVLGQTLRHADAERVNTTYVVLPLSAFVHGGPAAKAEGGGSLSADLAHVDRALSEVIDPLVAAGYLRWTSLPEMGDAYAAWEADCGAAPTAPTATVPAPSPVPAPSEAPSTASDPCPRGCVNFVVNVHDFTHASESADTVLRLTEIFVKAGVKGEFYVTWPVVEAWRRERKDVIARLRETGMAISYHSRPPHPLVPGFDDALAGLDGEALRAKIRDYETYAQDLTTGALDRSRPGGFSLVADTFGSPPLTVSTLHDKLTIKQAAYAVYREMGAIAALWYHESGTRLDKPLELRDGLLVRPSDLSVTRWAPASGGSPQFWWNRIARDPSFDPAAQLKRQLAAWSAPRGAIVTAIIHENDLSRSGNAGFTNVYFAGGDKEAPLPPPWDPGQPDLTRERSSAERQAIWEGYARMVSWAAANIEVVTAADLRGRL